MSVQLQSPLKFFEIHLQSPPSWRLAGFGPLTCLTLHWLSFAIINNKVVSRLTSVVSSDVSLLLSHGEWLMLAGLFGAAAYIIVPLFGAVVVICVDILIHDCRAYLRFVELVCLSFYILWPFLFFDLILALLFVPPEPVSATNLAAADFLDIARDYRLVVQSTPTFLLIRWAGLLSGGCIAVATSAAYRAVCHSSIASCVAVAVVLYAAYLQVI